mmetsp:Transcript_40699/g.64005  ORF Transcript_40699/g.64005 Transcript_40699/m.64005 type:complete len:499 (-) Transcript_40699:100-1596(-)
MSVRPLLCSGSAADESESGSERHRDDEEEVVEQAAEAEKKSVDSGETEGSESSEENEKEVKPYFLRPKKQKTLETKPETKPGQPGVTLDIGEPAPQVLDVVVWVRVDSITAIDLEKQSFTGDLWLFLVTAKEYKEGEAERKNIEEFFDNFPIDREHKSEYWGAIQNQVTAAASTDHPKPHLYKVGDRVGLAWRLSGEFSEAWELDNFPFDCQDLTISIMIRYPKKPGKYQMRFVRDGHPDRTSFVRDKNFPSLERTWDFPEKLIVWSRDVSHMKNMKKKKNESEICPVPKETTSNKKEMMRQILHVTLQVRRNPWYYVSNIVVPMFSIVLLSGSSFVIPAEKIQDRLSASLTLVLTAVAYKYNVVQTAPPIGYHTWLDWYVLMCYGALFAVVMENCISYIVFWNTEDQITKDYQQTKDYQNHVFVERRVVFTMFIAFLLLNLAFGLVACRARSLPSRIAKRLKENKEREVPWLENFDVLSPARRTCSFHVEPPGSDDD